MKDSVVRHPGYYIKRLYLKSGLPLEEFAFRLDMDKEDLLEIVQGSRDLTIRDCIKLSCLFGSSVEYWVNFPKDCDLSVL